MPKDPPKPAPTPAPPASIAPDSTPAPAGFGTAKGDIFPLQQLRLGGESCDLDMAAPNQHQKLLSALPGTLAEMARVTTLTAALAIAERFGGTRLYLPRQPDESSELVQLIGIRHARALCSHYSGEFIEVPRAAAVRRLLRDSKMCRARERGATVRKIAREYQLTQRQARRILTAGLGGHARSKRKLSRDPAGPRGHTR